MSAGFEAPERPKIVLEKGVWGGFDLADRSGQRILYDLNICPHFEATSGVSVPRVVPFFNARSPASSYFIPWEAQLFRAPARLLAASPNNPFPVDPDAANRELVIE